MGWGDRAALTRPGFVLIPAYFSAAETLEVECALQRYMQGDMLRAPGGFDGHAYACEIEGDLSTVRPPGCILLSHPLL